MTMGLNGVASIRPMKETNRLETSLRPLSMAHYLVTTIESDLAVTQVTRLLQHHFSSCTSLQLSELIILPKSVC